MIGVWIIYCLILSSGYSGNLKAYLTTPSYTAPMNNLKDVIDSGLPWAMVLYGEDEQRMMAESQNPIIKTIWEEKITEKYQPVPPVWSLFYYLKNTLWFQLQDTVLLCGTFIF